MLARELAEAQKRAAGAEVAHSLLLRDRDAAIAQRAQQQQVGTQCTSLLQAVSLRCGRRSYQSTTSRDISAASCMLSESAHPVASCAVLFLMLIVPSCLLCTGMVFPPIAHWVYRMQRELDAAREAAARQGAAAEARAWQERLAGVEGALGRARAETKRLEGELSAARAGVAWSPKAAEVRKISLKANPSFRGAACWPRSIDALHLSRCAWVLFAKAVSCCFFGESSCNVWSRG